MGVEQHAEAAAEKIVERYDEPHFDFVYEIIAKHLLDAAQGTTSVDDAIKAINDEANAMVDAKK